jgi:hypothetical protein
MFLALSCFAMSAPLARLLACASYHGKTKRTDYVPSGCLEVTDCFFQDQHEYAGGAIYVQNADLYVATTTFVGCYVYDTSYYCYGGAICHNGLAADIVRSCFREDESQDYGNAISFGCYDVCHLNDSTVLKCKERGANEYSEGGIYGGSSKDFYLVRLNFSDCRSAHTDSWGLILKWNNVAGFWSFSECTVVRCYGGSGLDHSALTVPQVSLTNFYNNSFPDGDGVLSTQKYGFTVDRCIFSGNSIEFVIVLSNPTQKFSVTSCVFSGQLPTGNIYKTTTNNRIQTQTASFPFDYFATEFCPNRPRARTASLERTVPQKTPAKSVASTPTNSPRASASSGFADSVLFPGTSFAKSAPPDFSAGFARSLSVGNSANYAQSLYVPNSAALAPTQFCEPPRSSSVPSTSPTSSSNGDAAAAVTLNVSVVLGAAAGAVLVVVVIIAIVLYRSRSAPKSSGSSEIEEGLTELPCVEPSVSDGGWATVLGVETENPVAQTIDPFGYNSDEA